MAKLYVNTQGSKEKINKKIYGHFSEHLGRCIYEGIFVGEDSRIPNTNGMSLIPPYDVTKEFMGPEDSRTAKGNAAIRHCYSSQYGQIAGAAGKEMKLILLPGPNTDKGTDIRPGVHACIKYSYKNRENGFKFVIYRPELQSDIPSVTLDVTLSGTEMAVLAILKQKPDSSRVEITDKISKTVRTVQRALDSLRDKGYIRRVGSKQNSIWEVLK